MTSKQRERLERLARGAPWDVFTQADLAGLLGYVEQLELGINRKAAALDLIYEAWMGVHTLEGFAHEVNAVLNQYMETRR